MFAKTSSFLGAGMLLAAAGLSTIAAGMRDRDPAPQQVDNAFGGLPDSDVRIAASIAGPDAESASAVSLFWPAGPGQQGSSPVVVPVIVYFREAGTARSDSEHAGTARALAKSADAVVVSVSLQADQTRDGLAAYQWTLANAQGLGGDPRRVAVMGEGQAGAVAMAVAARARYAHLPPPYYLVLVNAPATSVVIQPATAKLPPAADPHLQAIAWSAAIGRSARSTNKTYRAM